MKRTRINENHVFEEMDYEPDASSNDSDGKTIICQNTTREALEILLGMNVESDALSDQGMEGPSTGEPEPEIITAARNLRSRLVKEGIL